MLQVITDKKEWTDLIQEFPHFDFYHTHAYHELSKKDNETPILLKFEDKNDLIVLPLLLRPIIGTDCKDATSVYGYAGPLLSTPKQAFNNAKFKDELQVFLKDNKIISVFSRLHPYFENQESILEGIGEITLHGAVVNIDLTLSPEIQRQNYSSRLKTYLNKARRQCTVYEGVTEDDMQEFIKIYHENMRRVNANSNYFYDAGYFHKLKLSSDFETELLLCRKNDDDEVVGGAIFIKTGNIVQYHLAGSKTEYLHMSPIKLIIDEMRLRSTSQNYTYLNLGGGKANNEDSLFAFKSSFSKDFKFFKLWKHVVDPEIYDSLTQQELNRIQNTPTDKELCYFPAYRILSQISPQET